jgi:hypothetical protein
MQSSAKQCNACNARHGISSKVLRALHALHALHRVACNACKAVQCLQRRLKSRLGPLELPSPPGRGVGGEGEGEQEGQVTCHPPKKNHLTSTLPFANPSGTMSCDDARGESHFFTSDLHLSGGAPRLRKLSEIFPFSCKLVCQIGPAPCYAQKKRQPIRRHTLCPGMTAPRMAEAWSSTHRSPKKFRMARMAAKVANQVTPGTISTSYPGCPAYRPIQDVPPTAVH